MTLPSKIQQLWNICIQVEQPVYEKYVWLEIFLAEFLLQFKDGKAVEDLCTGLGGGVATQIACELLSEVHSICSQPTDGDDLAPLRQHFLRGRGWQKLAVLNLLGVQSLSCGRELASLLISLYPVCMQSPAEMDGSSNPYVPCKETRNIEDTLLLAAPAPKLKSRWSTSLCPPTRDFTRTLSNTSTHRTRSGPRTPVGSDGVKELPLSSESDAPDSETDLLIQMKGHTSLKIRLDPMDFDYFTSVVRSEDDSRLDSHDYSPAKKRREGLSEVKRSPEEFKDERVAAVTASTISCFEFFRLVTELLQGLCEAEVGVSPDNGHQISVQAVNFALENLCTLQFRCETLPASQAAELKASMTRLLLLALEKVLLHPEVTATVIHNGTLPVMLKVLEDAVSRLSSLPADYSPSPEEARGTQEFVFGLAYGATTFLLCLLPQRATVDKFRDFLELLQLFSDSHCGRLVEQTVAVLVSAPHVEQRASLARAGRLVDSVGRLVTALKKVRGEIVHSHQCRRARHRHCSGTVAAHHHHDLFGCVYNSSLVRSNTHQVCSISALFTVLVRLLQGPIAARTLRVMTACGTCCCFPPRTVVCALLEMLRDPRCRPLALSLLERTLYVELGALGMGMGVGSSHDASCIICLAPHCGDESWGCVKLFRDLLGPADSRLSHDVLAHLVKVAPRFSASVRLTLLFDVFYPAFLVAKDGFLLHGDDVSRFCLLSCLSAFASLLTSSVLAALFVSRDGLVHVYQLVSRPALAALCCSVLETTATLEICQLGEAEKLTELPSLAMLQDAVEGSTRQALAILERYIDQDEEPREVKELENSMGYVVIPSPCPIVDASSRVGSNPNLSVPQNVPRPSTPVDETPEHSCPTINTPESGQALLCGPERKSYLELMANLCVFWRSCTNLVLYSPRYRGHLPQEALGALGYQLLLSLLGLAAHGSGITDKLEDGSNRNSEMYLYMKLIEALLTVSLTAPLSDQHAGVVMEKLELILLGRDVSNVRPLCDVMIRCAVTSCSPQQSMPPANKPKMPSLQVSPSWAEDLSDADDADEPSEAMRDPTLGELSSPDDTYITADEGYEADVEVPPDCNSNDATQPCPRSPSPTGDGYSSSGNSPQGANSSWNGHHNGGIVHPALCTLSVDLLVHTNNRLGSGESGQLGCVVHSLQRLVALCRDSPANCVSLANHGVGQKLLTGFAHCLDNCQPGYLELQRVVLELVTLLARHSISPRELSLYLDLFKSDHPPLDCLLNPLTSLVCGLKPQPNYILCFPGDMTGNVPDCPTGENVAGNLANTLHQQHVQARVNSSWRHCALALPLNLSLGWSMWQQGFSLSLWLRVERGQGTPGSDLQLSRSDSEWGELWNMDGLHHNTPLGMGNPPTLVSCNGGPLHIFSIGYETLVLEAWINPANDVLTLKLTRPGHRGCETLAESTVENLLPPSQWHHLAVNVNDHVYNRTNVVQVVLLVDGWKEARVGMVWGGLLLRKARPTCLLLGHSTPNAGRWYLGSLMLFRSPVFTRERAVYLVGLGPNHTNLTDCDVDRHCPNLTGVFGPQTLSSGIDWEAVLDAGTANLKELQDHLLLIYSAQSPTVVSLYPQVVSNPGGGVGSLFPGQTGFRVVTLDPRASQQLPLSETPTLLAPLSPRQYRGLVPAAIILGGVPVFLFLFARVVELGANEEHQARAVFLLLKLCQADGELFSQFVTQDCHKLLLRVLSSPRCIAGNHMLKAVLDTCCDKPVLQFHPGPRKFQVCQQSDAIVVNSFLLSTIVGAWRDWERGCPLEDGGGVLGTLFRALHVLLRDDHPYREFNATQLNRVRMVEALLLFCKERFLYEESLQLHPLVCCSLVELVRSLMGAPPEFSHIVAVTDFLVLLHQASATYITHVRPSFYFLLSANPPRNLGRGRAAAKPVLFLMGDDDSKPISIRKKDCPESNVTQPVDPQKLSKALTNLQIKQSSVDSLANQTASEMDSNRAADKLCLVPEVLNEDKGAQETRRSADTYPGCKDTASGGDRERPPTSEKGWFNGKEIDLDSYEKFTMETQEVKEPSSPKDKSISSQCLVVEGLLLLLRDTLLVLPDNMADQVLNHVVKAECLLVMSNHSDPRVRTSVVKVLSAYLQRSSDEELNKFVKLRGFHQLANQLGLFPATPELVEACVGLVTRCGAPLEDQAELSSCLSELSYLQLGSFPPLLALLPRSVHDTALAHNLLLFLRHALTKVSQAPRSLLDGGLLEVLVKTLVAVAHLPPEPSDLCGVTEQDLLLADLHVFLITVTGQALHTPGAHHMQVVSDVLLQLSFMEREEMAGCGADCRGVSVLRDTQCVVLEAALDILLDKISALGQTGSRLNTTSSFLSSVLTPSYEEATGGEMLSHSVQQKFSAGHTRDLTRGEVTERFKSIIAKSVDFLVNVEPSEGPNPSPCEHNFARRLLSTLLQGLTTILEKRGSGQRSAWYAAMWAARDTLRVHTGLLLVWLLSPYHTVKLRMFVVHTMRGEPSGQQLLSAILRTHTQVDHMTVFLSDLTHNCCSLLSTTDLRSCHELREQLDRWGFHPTENSRELWREELKLVLADLERQRLAAAKHNEAATIRSVHRYEGLMKTVAEAAMAITRTVVEAQNGERKAFMDHIKMAYSENVHIRIRWQKIVQQLTHERAVWFFPNSYPRSWQLDATEGPSRVRNRLQRCHLSIGDKYFLPDAAHKQVPRAPDPLSFLFEHDHQSSTSSVLIERLHTNEKIRHMCTARVVTPANEVPGELLIGESCLYFVADDSTLDTDLYQVTAGSLDVSSTAWQFENVKEIHHRRFQLQERALEIFLLNGKTYLVAFESARERDSFVWELEQCHWPNRVAGDNLSDAVHLWRDGQISNWDYLTQLNKMAGRSFNDLMQYPVFPFVLADYTSRTLDLRDPHVYRNFKRPMAVQDKKNEQHYISNYNYLKQELLDGLNLVTLNQVPYHYGSHYSNSGTVLHFLVRLPPFTSMFLTYQDENFDLPDRTFHSLYTAWRLASSESTTDVKEMIPEFFFLPEFLVNSEQFDFGVRQSGEGVADVELPPWCRGNPRLFVLIHRQALESDFARENLPHWVDLVFGYKQTGKAAVDAVNVFHPATYYGFDVDSISDPLERLAWETMVRTYGQTPRQLFRTAHPMVVQALSSRTAPFSVPEVIPGLRGLVWGSYVGSPAEPEPVVAWKHQHNISIGSLVPLLTNDVFGLGPQTSILLSYSKEKGMSLVNTTSVLGAALVTWGHSDGVVRVKLKKDQPPWPVVKSTPLDPVCLCQSVPDCNQLWLAHVSGKLVVYRCKLSPSKGQIEFGMESVTLLGHRGPVLDLHICRGFSVVVSGSRDGTAIVWDLNSLSYVRSVTCAGPTRLVSVSETSGDIATVADYGTGSVLALCTVNTTPVNSVTTWDQITAICFSGAPEGLSVNVVATGFDTGTIRLWSTWDLSFVREITTSVMVKPIISLAYSHDAQHLYASSTDGYVVIWEGGGVKGAGKTPKFLNLTSL